jgi:hypothetical protein
VIFPVGDKPTRAPKERRYIPHSNAAGRRIAKAESACSRLTEKRAGGICECCGGIGNQTAHGIGKGANPIIRFDGRNLYWVCNTCHRRGESDRAWWEDQQIRILGMAQRDALLVRACFGDMDDPREVLAAASAGRFLVERT